MLEAATGAVLCESALLRRAGAEGAPAPGLAVCGGGAVAALAWPDRLVVFSVPWSTQAVEVLAVYDVEEVGRTLPCHSPTPPFAPSQICNNEEHSRLFSQTGQVPLPVHALKGKVCWCAPIKS